MPDLVTPDELVEEVRRRVAAVGDPEKAGPMQAYMKSALPYRGLTAQPLARLLRQVYAEHALAGEDDWREAVVLLWDEAAYREEWYAAIALARHPRHAEHQQPHTLDLYRHLVVTGAWWDVVDDVATHLVRGLLERHPEAVTPVLHDWAEEDDLWLRRTAIVCQVGRKDALDRDLLVAALDANLEGSAYGREFFVRKAVGWALRDHAGVAPEWVRAYVAERGDRLSGLSRREATKHL